MHELSVCQALLAQVAQIVSDHGAAAVERITVEVGRLSGTEPALLARAFEFARAGTCASSAALSIQVIEITVHCLSCGAQSQAKPNRLLCAMCGAYGTRVVGGDELRLDRWSCPCRVRCRLQRHDPARGVISMCKTCGCTVTRANTHLEHERHGQVIEVLQDLLAHNHRVAAHNREHFEANGVLAINLMSSPGAGKTSLLEATIVALRDRYRIAVIEGRSWRPTTTRLASGPTAYRRSKSRREPLVIWMPASSTRHYMICRWRVSISSSSKMWAISSVRPVSI